ncbi:MAG: S8 family serine peptidase [Novosphingobium sp.]
MTGLRNAQLPIALLAGLLTVQALAASGKDPDLESRAQQRLDRDTQRAADRAAERAARFTVESAKIEERALRDPDKAAEERIKLEADRTRQEVRTADELAKVQEDFQEDSAKEAEDRAKEAEDQAEREAKEAERASELASSEDSSGHGSSESMRDLAANEGAEHDERGFPVRRGELVGIDISPETLSAAQARGFKIIERRRIEALDREIIRISAPQGVSAVEARSILRNIDPRATVDFDHYYGLNLTAGGHGRPIRGRLTAALPQQPLAVGMIDTAVRQHPALGQSRLIAWRPGTQGSAPVEHGTAVASLLAESGRATIWSANIFRGPASRPYTSADVIADALGWMIQGGTPVINMSLSGPRNAILDRLIADALASGRTVVAAAGNGGPTAPPAWPAAVPGVIAVTAVDKDGRIYRYANRGRHIAVAALGVDIVAANANGGFARFSGTSFATPRVAGWLARCRARGGSAGDCTNRLRKSARDLGAEGFDEVYGFGLVE